MFAKNIVDGFVDRLYLKGTIKDCGVNAEIV